MNDDPIHWEDKELRFDTSVSALKLGPGEKIFIQSSQIEDSKGNPNNLGNFQVTNLRCIWYQITDPKTNLSLGYNCLLQFENRLTNTKNGVMPICNIKAKQKNSRFEFIFQSVGEEAKKVFETLKSCHQSYQETRLYREIKARGAICDNKNLILFDNEKVISTYKDIASIAQEGNLTVGKMFFTNVRMAWFASQNETFNISIPWICMKQIRKKEIKGGPSLIIETKTSCGGYIVGYRGQDIEKITIEAQKICLSYIEKPFLGVSPSDPDLISSQQQNLTQFNEDVEIIETGYSMNSVSSKSYNIGGDNTNEQQQIVFAPQLGLAIEKLPEGTSIEELWKIINIK